MEHITKSITVMRPRDEVFGFWRRLENLPRFMHHLQDVRTTSDTRSHWVTKGPAGSLIEWDAEIVDEEPNEFISWKTVGGSEVEHTGSVRFADAPADRGTEIEIDLGYDAPGGKAGELIAKLFGEEPKQQLTDDLRRFKQVMETGEVTLSEGSLQGAGEGASAERPAQAPAESVVRR
jgi:uncharacterized membrane protein